MKQFISIIVIIFLIIGCSSESDKSLVDSARQKISDENYVAALADFRKVLDNYPKTKLRAEVLFELGKLYHGKVDKTLTDEQSFEKAIEYYSMVQEEYPNDENSPNALFMVGFLQANELNQLDSARQTYNIFLEKYPNNEMAVSAKAELENLGISAEEILQKKITKGESE